MTVASYFFFCLALICYVATTKSVWTLVSEAREAAPERRFSRFWWPSAWKVHRKLLPDSKTRQQIVRRFSLTFVLLLISTGFMAVNIIPRVR